MNRRRPPRAPRSEPRPDRFWLIWAPLPPLFAALIGEAFAPSIVRWFATVPRPARVVRVEDGDPVVQIDTGAAEPVWAHAHGTFLPGDPLDVTVRHVPLLPGAAVLDGHVSLGWLVVLAVLVCLAVPAVWARWGLVAAWNTRRRRRPPRDRNRRRRPEQDRDRGADLWVPVLARAVPAVLCVGAGTLAAGWGLAAAAVDRGRAPDVGAVGLLFAAWVLLPVGAVLAVRALLRYADRAPVRTVPAAARTLPARAASALLAAALVLAVGGTAGGWAWGLLREHQAMATTEAGTAEAYGTREVSSRGGCRGEAVLRYVVQGVPYWTTVRIPCRDVDLIRAERTVDVEWSTTAPEHVRWTR
ncbi:MULTISPECIES: hypothetical protein [unclassified Nocardiopsis]|uniref:hypothetical protein n=1 Tax=Nocardiopsis TaxID=2013 RepID=UPI00387ADA2D